MYLVCSCERQILSRCWTIVASHKARQRSRIGETSPTPKTEQGQDGGWRRRPRAVRRTGTGTETETGTGGDHNLDCDCGRLRQTARMDF